MFPCFSSLNQSLSHLWAYISCPSIFQKLQSRHQHISFSHFSCIAETQDLYYLLHLFICLSCLCLLFYLSLPSFLYICLYLLFYLSLPSILSVSTFFFIFFIYLSHLFYLKIIFLFFNHDLLVFSNYYGLQMDFW